MRLNFAKMQKNYCDLHLLFNITSNTLQQFSQLLIHFNISLYLKEKQISSTLHYSHNYIDNTLSAMGKSIFLSGQNFPRLCKLKVVLRQNIQCEFEYPTCIEKHFPYQICVRDIYNLFLNFFCYWKKYNWNRFAQVVKKENIIYFVGLTV